MASKQLRGVGGVLGNLLSQPEAAQMMEREETSNVPPDAAPQKPEPPPDSKEREPVSKPGQGVKRKARLGRPPTGSKASEPVEREKVSLRIRADLAAAYRDWSWEEHCQFSDLVDRALESYLKSRRKARMPERE
jgi:hypothetical protein